MLAVICTFQQYFKIYGDEYTRKGRRRSFSIDSPFSLHNPYPSLKRQRTLFSTFGWCFLLYFAWYFRRRQMNWIRTVSTMGTKKKGIFQGFIYSLSQIFEVEKEPEIEIGLPTDVKHVAHIGWDSPSGTGPGWMNEFKKVPNFSAMSIGNYCSALSPMSSQDFGESIWQKSGYEIHRDLPLTEVAGIRKKQKRKKSKSSSSPKPSSSSSSSSSSTRVPKSKSKFVEGHAKPINIKVA